MTKEEIYQTIKETLRRCNPNATPEELEKMTKDYVAKAAGMARTARRDLMIQDVHMTLRMMRFGRKAPTTAELRAQWLEQQRHEAEIRQRFTTAERI